MRRRIRIRFKSRRVTWFIPEVLAGVVIATEAGETALLQDEVDLLLGKVAQKYPALRPLFLDKRTYLRK